MRLRLLSLFLLCTGVLTLSCNRNAVVLDSTNARDEVPRLINLHFRFSKSLAPDSLLNSWDSTEYIKFEPAIRGRFRWESPDVLVFSPAAPLAPATTYKAKMTNEVLRYSKFGMVEKADKIEFHTPHLAVDDVQVFWTAKDESGKNAYPQVDLFFNYPVKPDEIKNKLKITVDGKEKEFTLVTQSPENKISVSINDLTVEDKDYQVKVTLAKGIKPLDGNNSTPDDLVENFNIPSPFVLLIQSVEGQHDGQEGSVVIRTSQPLVAENIKTYIKVDPEINYSVELTESGALIRSEGFNVDKSYTLNFLKGLRGRLGGVLKEEVSQQVAFGELESGINFTNNKGIYLSKQGAKNMEIRITNTPKVKLIISKVYENNLLLAQRYGYSPREKNAYYSEYEEGEYSYSSYSDMVLGDVIYEKEIDTRNLPRSGGGHLLNFSQFEDRLPDFNGIYHVVVRSTESYWVQDSRFVSVSDIGLIAREGTDKMVVFANSIKTATSLAGVNIMVYGGNNQLLGSGATNSDGVAEIEMTKKEYSGFKPAMIIAKTADDFNYLPFNSTRVNTSRFEVGGKRNNPTGLDTYIYAERDIYRPGEKINFSVIIRDRQWKSPGEIPVLMKMLMPNGKELKTFRKTLNEEGSIEGSVDLATSAITGGYTLEVYSSNEVLLGTQNFNVEEFVPDRIRVQSKLDKESIQTGETANVQVTATNFFGPPAANRNYELEIQVRRQYFSPEKFEGYNFNLENMSSIFDKNVSQGQTDANGQVSGSYTLTDVLKNMGLLQAIFYTTVFDETGRPVSRSSSLNLYTQPVFYGIQREGYYYQPLNTAAKFKLAAVNKSGAATSASAKVQVIKHEYHTNLVKSGGYFRYESQKEDKLMEEKTLTIGNGSSYSYVPRSPGDYEIRVYAPDANTYVSESFYSYGNWGWGSSNSTFEVNNEGHIDIALDKGKNSYFTNETAVATFKTPFDGRMLVTMETDKIVSYQYVNVEKRTAQLSLPISPDHLPNVYVTATLIKPHEMTDMPLTVAHGYQNLRVEDKSRKIAVEIDAKKTVRSRTSQEITVKAAPGSYVTLSAVDNGVLQVSSFKTPDPYDHFYSKKALQVNGYDLYPLLLPEVRGRLSSTGGDGDLSMEKRVNPMPAKRIKVVSFWSGISKADGSGVAKFNVQVPQFSGEIRLMAVAYKGSGFGAGENTMTVADPVVISTALPRFLSPGDTVTVPVTLSNTTAKAATVSAQLKTDGPLKVLGGNSQSVNLGPNSEGRATFRIVADPVMAVSKVRVEVNGMGEKFFDETEISVRPASTLQKVTGSGVVKAGATQSVQIGTTDFIPSSVDYKLVVSRSPVLEWGKQLEYLVQYPYGCTEQTVSAAFPQLYFGDLVDVMNKKGVAASNANYNVMEAIRKIKMRQVESGALTLWDGEGYPHWWTTVYATHFLLEARKAGFTVENSLLDPMLAYLTNQLRYRETIPYYYNRDQNRKIAPKEVPYSLFVLALAGRSNIPSMNYYKANPDLLALDGKYLLSAAYAVAGDRKSFTNMLPASFAGEESVSQAGGSWYSDLRDEAVALNAILEVDPANKQVGVMARHVSDKLKSREWLSTQERSFGFLALGKIARAAAQSNATAEIKVGGKTIAKVDGGNWTGDKAALKGSNIEIVTKGSGQLYFFWEAEGISATGSYKEEDSYLRVRRRFYDRFGKELSGSSFKQNDLVVIGVSLEKSYSGTVENVVITDLLPAGFEIENPRTKEIPGMDWIKDGYTPTALDVRDDRIHFFIDMTNNKQTYYYAVRAVSPGYYRMGPVSADAMYKGEYHSYHGARMVRIE